MVANLKKESRRAEKRKERLQAKNQRLDELKDKCLKLEQEKKTLQTLLDTELEANGIAISDIELADTVGCFKVLLQLQRIKDRGGKRGKEIDG